MQGTAGGRWTPSNLKTKTLVWFLLLLYLPRGWPHQHIVDYILVFIIFINWIFQSTLTSINLNFNQPQFQSTSTQHGCDIKATQSCSFTVFFFIVAKLIPNSRFSLAKMVFDVWSDIFTGMPKPLYSITVLLFSL